MQVYLDDIRKEPDGWVRTYWPKETIELLKSGLVQELSLDHDLGDDTRGTGYDVVKWIEEQVVVNGFIPPIIHIHTANPAAKKRMTQGVESIIRWHLKIMPNQSLHQSP